MLFRSSDSIINIRHREIVVNSETDYYNYINQIVSEENINSFKDKMKEAYDLCKNKYDDSHWNENWIKLCAGKQVYSKIINDFSFLRHKRL